MAQIVNRCPIAMPLETLSAWHDRELNTAETGRVQEHIQTCPACQNYLTIYATETRAIKQFDAPQLQDRIWRGLQEDITSAKQHRHPALPRGVILGGLGASLAVVVLFSAIAVIWANNHGHSLSITPTPSVTSTVTVLPSPTRTPVHLPNIWQSVQSVNYGKAIAFAQSDPQTGYVCGNAGHAASTLKLGATHDGGFTWTTHTVAGITGAYCDIAISPYDMNDIVLSAISCWYICNTSTEVIPYRSFDGGNTWTRLVLPTGNEASGVTIPVTPIWTPTTLFFEASNHFSPLAASPGTPGAPPPPHEIAASVNRGPLTWIPNPDPDVGGWIFAVGNSIHHLSPYGNDLATSSNNGVTWTHVTALGGTLPAYVQPITYGSTVIGLGGTDYLRSIDAGKTWSPLPAPITPDSMGVSLAQEAATPDGSFFGENLATNSSGVYKIAPGATSWVLVAPPPEGLTAVSWNTDGHPMLVWSISESNIAPNYPTVLEFHPA